MFTASLYIGKMNLSFEAESIKEVWQKIQFLADVPEVCAVCQDSLVPNYYKTKPPGNFEYYGVKCTGPVVHQLNFHEAKENKGFYIKGDEATNAKAWTAYDATGRNQDEADGGPNVPAENDLDKMAEAIAGNMKREGNTFVFGSFTVSVTPERKLVCDCPRFVNAFGKEPEFKCEHVRATIIAAQKLKAEREQAAASATGA